MIRGVVFFIFLAVARADLTADDKFDLIFEAVGKIFGFVNLEQDEKIRGLEERIDDAMNTITTLVSVFNNISTESIGTTYVRWGENTCPHGVQTVYNGYAAGSNHEHRGSGSNFLCLPKDPTWDDDIVTILESKSTVTGVDYQIPGLLNYEVPCAVCWIPRTSTRMFPGRKQCYDEWKLEYHGFLASTHHENYRADYICLDAAVQTTGRPINQVNNGAWLYFTEVRCGSLPCSIYQHGRDLACAVCSYAPKMKTNRIHLVGTP